MSHRLSLSLPDRLHDDIVAAARRDHVSPAVWVRRKLATSLTSPDARSLRENLTERERRLLLERSLLRPRSESVRG